METINYNKANKKKGNGPFIAIGAFLVVGIGIITFSLLNEAKPNVIGEQDSLKNVQNNEEDKNKAEINIAYNVSIGEFNDTENKAVTASMQIPNIYTEGDLFKTINQEIENDIKSRYNILKEQMVGNVENKYKYTVNFETFENIVNNKKVLSIKIVEKMQDTGNKKTTYLESKTYNIYVNQKEKVKGSIAVDVLGKDYKQIMLEDIKQEVVNKGYIREENFNYDVTDLEEWYIKEGNIHMVFNPGKLVEEKYGIMDIEITK